MWVKWADKFADSMEYQSERRGKDKWEAGQTEWSAEEQADLAINEQNKQDIKKALEDKIIWPWIQVNYFQKIQFFKLNISSVKSFKIYFCET